MVTSPTAADMLASIWVEGDSWQGVVVRGAAVAQARLPDREPALLSRDGTLTSMLHLRVTTPSDLTDEVVGALSDDPAVSSLVVMRGAAVLPEGDVVLGDVAREAANEIVDRLETLGVPQVGTIHLEPVDDLDLTGRVRRRTRHPRQQRRCRRVGRGHPAGLRGDRAQLDLPVVHDPGHAAGQHRDRRRLPDPGDRSHGPGPGVRRDRGARPGARTPTRLTLPARGADPVHRVRGRDRV